MGSICIYYVIATIVLGGIQTALKGNAFRLLSEYKEELTFLIPCGLAFHILAEVFSNAKKLKEENDLTV